MRVRACVRACARVRVYVCVCVCVCDAVLKKVGTSLARTNRPFIVGGGWNATPDDLDNSGLPIRLQATVVCGASPTCSSKTESGIVERCLDFFVVSDVLVPLVRSVQTLGVGTRPHQLVKLTMSSFARLPKVWVP